MKKKVLFLLWTAACILFGVWFASHTMEETEYSTDKTYSLNDQMQFEIYQPNYSIEAASCDDFLITKQDTADKLDGQETTGELGWPCDTRFYDSIVNQKPGIWIVEWYGFPGNVDIHITAPEMIRITTKYNNRTETINDFIAAGLSFLIWIVVICLAASFYETPKEESQ